MYCIKCGVKLENSEKTCPLCGTSVCHPDFTEFSEPLYPSDKQPTGKINSKFVCGAVVILFLIPLAVCFFADFNINKQLDWFGYVVGGLSIGYITFALPFWFKSPNPVIFTPCTFAAILLYLLYIDLSVKGGWFLGFAFPFVGGLGVIVCATVTLLHYLRRGKLFILGGATVALGAFMPLAEFLMVKTFAVKFLCWSVYPLACLLLFGGFLIYLGISKTAREMVERKFFF